MKKYPGVFEDKDGTYYIQPRVKDVFGNTKKTTIRGFKKAKEAFDAKLDLQDGRSNNKVNINNGIKECGKQYITYERVFMENLDFKLAKGKIGKSTYNTNLRRNKSHILPVIGHMNIFDITTETYKQLQLELKNSKNTDLSVGTINGLHSDTVSTLKYATLFYGLQYNVAMMVGPIYEDRDNINGFVTLEDMTKIGKAEALNTDEWERMVRILENRISNETNPNKKIQNIKDMLFYICEFILMMRVGEVQGLSYENIIYDKNVIFLNKAYSKDAKEITPLKNRTARFVYPTQSVLELFKLCEKEDSKYIGFDRKQLIFGYTGHFSRTTILRRLKLLQEEANIDKNLTNHKLRHGIISNMLYENVDSTIVAEVAGHNKEMTMNVYNQSVNKAKEDLLEKLDKLYVPKIDKN